MIHIHYIERQAMETVDIGYFIELLSNHSQVMALSNMFSHLINNMFVRIEVRIRAHFKPQHRGFMDVQYLYIYKT